MPFKAFTVVLASFVKAEVATQDQDVVLLTSPNPLDGFLCFDVCRLVIGQYFLTSKTA